MAKEFDYFALMEATTPEQSKPRMLKENVVNGETRSLRFEACMQSFGHRNRNGRLWVSKFMKPALEAPHLKELIQKGDLAGENGHPVPPTGEASLARISTIDPNNICHRILNFTWRGELVYSTIETIDDINGPGAKFMRSIMQGMEPAFSVRALVPQRRNADGTIDVTGPGRVITYDRVILPSHPEAYRDINVDIKQVVRTANYAQVMESLVLPYLAGASDNVKYVADDMGVALEGNLGYDRKSGRASITQRGEDTVVSYVPVEKHVRKKIDDIFKML